MERVAAWSCGLLNIVKCTSCVYGTSSSRQVHACHEQFAHDTTCSRSDCDQLTSASMRGVYKGVRGHTSPFHNFQRTDKMLKPKPTRGRGNQRGPQPDKLETETAERDASPSHPHQVAMSQQRHSRLPSTPRESHPVRKRRQCSRRSGPGSQIRKCMSTARHMRG